MPELAPVMTTVLDSFDISRTTEERGMPTAETALGRVYPRGSVPGPSPHFAFLVPHSSPLTFSAPPALKLRSRRLDGAQRLVPLGRRVPARVRAGGLLDE